MFTKKKFTWPLLTSTLVSTFIITNPAYAQENIEEIVVTALKREGTIQNTPISVSVLSGDFLKETGVTSLVDLQNVTPNLKMDTSGFGVNINIRGVTTTDNTSKGDQGIAFNVDGITIGRPLEMAVAFFDINRVEILRGPQGTLYGKSTTGGVVNLITNRPENEFGGKVDMEIGNYNRKQLLGILNIPVTENFSTRFGFQHTERDGYVEIDNSRVQQYDFPDGASNEAVADQKDSIFRASALWDISDSMSWYVTASKSHLGGLGNASVPLYYFHNGENKAIGVPSAITPKRDTDFKNITTEFSAQFGGIDVSYTGGYRSYDANNFTAQSLAPSAPNAPPCDPLVCNTWDWGQYRGTSDLQQHELRISNSEPNSFAWMVGLNDYQEKLTESDHGWSAPTTNPIREASSPGIDPLNSTNHFSRGVYASFDFFISERLTLNAGARYSEDEVVRRGTFAVGAGQVDANGDSCVYPNDCVGGPNNATQSDSKVTYKVGVDYGITDDAMVYAMVSTGYKAGGFNDFDPLTGGPGTYEPEELTAIELGYKGDIGDSLTWNSAIFSYDYAKAQISSLTNVSGNVIIFTRATPITMWGWENELVWDLSDDDRINASFTTMDSEYDDFDAGGHGPGEFPPIGAEFVAWDGLAIDKVSDFTASLNYTHDFVLDNGAALTLRLGTRYDSGYVVSNIVNAYQIEQDSYTRSDISFAFSSPNEKYRVTAYVRNIEDEVQMQGTPGSQDKTTLEEGVSISEPRTFGVSLGMKF